MFTALCTFIAYFVLSAVMVRVIVRKLLSSNDSKSKRVLDVCGLADNLADYNTVSCSS